MKKNGHVSGTSTDNIIVHIYDDLVTTFELSIFRFTVDSVDVSGGSRRLSGYSSVTTRSSSMTYANLRFSSSSMES